MLELKNNIENELKKIKKNNVMLNNDVNQLIEENKNLTEEINVLTTYNITKYNSNINNKLLQFTEKNNELEINIIPNLKNK